MTDQQPNWAQAPADATHWDPQAPADGVSPWRKIKNDYWFRWVPMNQSGQWRRLDYPEPETYTKRPSTEEPDWRQAPSATTHVLITADGECQWRSIEGDTVRAWTGCQWRIVGALPMDRYIPRPGTEQPAPPTWDGQDLPPVGAQVEYERYKGVWVAAGVIGYDSDAVVVGAEETGYHARRLANLRPILTAEKRAAAQRREAIAEMLTDIDARPGANYQVEHVVAALYDAGWRKKEGE